MTEAAAPVETKPLVADDEPMAWDSRARRMVVLWMERKDKLGRQRRLGCGGAA